MRCYRIVRPEYAAMALSGEGARLYGGRWNPPGYRCVYAAGSRALAVLELLVHLSPQTRDMPLRLLEVEVPDELVSPPILPPRGWDAQPAGNDSQDHGKHWLRRNRHAALRIPSVVIPQEENLLLNPSAPGFERVEVVGESSFRLDLRLAV